MKDFDLFGIYKQLLNSPYVLYYKKMVNSHFELTVLN
jgi:hypothetical protein